MLYLLAQILPSERVTGWILTRLYSCVKSKKHVRKGVLHFCSRMRFHINRNMDPVIATVVMVMTNRFPPTAPRTWNFEVPLPVAIQSSRNSRPLTRLRSWQPWLGRTKCPSRNQCPKLVLARSAPSPSTLCCRSCSKR